MQANYLFYKKSDYCRVTIMNYIQNNEGVNSEIYNYCKDDINLLFFLKSNRHHT